MIAVITRVKSASVSVEGEFTANIKEGLLVLLGVAKGDTEADAAYLADKVTSLRIFNDEAGKMGRSVSDVAGSIVVVPNFTLNADCKKGRRPDFTASAPPAEAKQLYEMFAEFCSASGREVQTGIFGADMAVVSHNDGPVTIVMDTKTMRRS